MGSLMLIPESFELSDIPIENRYEVISNFCAMSDRVKEVQDCFYSSNELYTYQYSYGNLYEFLYDPWEKIKDKPIFDGISQVLHQLLMSSFNVKIQDIEKEEFVLIEGNKGFAGFDYFSPDIPYDYVKCVVSWYNWRIKWMAHHPEDIKWTDDNFLPNKHYSNLILREELEKVKGRFDRSRYVDLFYEHVMKPKKAGGEKEGYIREIGTRLCQANYYTYDREVSDKNKERSGYGVLRVIFSIIGRQGKKQYISLDFEKGMFEYYDYLGRHMGEYRFDGSNNKRAERSHDILV